MAARHHLRRRAPRRFLARLMRGRLRWYETVAAALLAVLVGLPVALVLVYRVVPPPLTTVMAIRLVEGEGATRDWVSLGDISPHLRRAVIAAEDNRFCEHTGVDWAAFRAALSAEMGGGGADGGASTLTMQTARNLMLWPQRSYVRKALEVYVAGLIEMLWPKRRIMEVYLNIAEWGPGVFGAEAAARHHFGVSAREITAAEAARLAVVLPAPRRLHATASTGHVPSQATIVARRVGQLGPLLACIEDR